MTHIVFKDDQVVFTGDSLPAFDDDTLIVTNNLEEYDPGFAYSVLTIDGVATAVKGEAVEIPHPPEQSEDPVDPV
jgi:hypothetical protein